MRSSLRTWAAAVWLWLTGGAVLSAALVEYDLTVSEQRWAPEGHRAGRAVTINGGIPGPTLRFRVGDTARIRVHNRLKKETTSVHWHGLLVPMAQDGVPGVTTPPIEPGTTHVFEFPLRHAGTYWYHSHTDLQEQEGAFGSIVIEPRGGQEDRVATDQVVVLSDWTQESPGEVMRNLRRESEWYEWKKGSVQSLSDAAKKGVLTDFFQREKSRMPAMDISDIAYDAFLMNGRERSELSGVGGKRVKLRLINAAASTYFYLEFAGGPMTVVAADGPRVEPIRVKRLLIGMAETYDLLLDVPKGGRWELRATAQDGSGKASYWLGEGEEHPAPEVPRPELYRMDDHLMAAMEEGESKAPKSWRDEAERPLSPYARLRSPKPTELKASLPRRTIELRATGDMERYVWSFNGKTFGEDGVIPVRKGEVLRLELINDTMMHHPLHLHGHFFRVLMGQGAYSPLKHTIDLPPMSRRVIEFETNEPGDWLFHCHLLYHMHAGMTRIFSYQPDGWTPPGKPKEGTNVVCNDVCCLPGNPEARTGAMDPRFLGHHPHPGGHDHDPLMFLGDVDLTHRMSEGRLMLRNAKNDYWFGWEQGWEDSEDGELEAGWLRYVNPDFSWMLGYRHLEGEDDPDRGWAGIRYRLPYLVESGIQVDTAGEARFLLGKSMMLTDRLKGFAEVEYDTGTGWEWSTGMEYLWSKPVSLLVEYDSDYQWGVGVRLRF